MARQSPINPLHEQAAAMVLPYGPDPSSTDATEPISVVGTYGELELEYAAIRKGCLLLDLPQRAVLEVTGTDRLEFLNRMVTQELKPSKKWLESYRAVSSFWLNRKGRIDADFRVIVLPDRVLLECDAHAAPRAMASLGGFVITEDVAIADASATTHRLALHGPTGPALLAATSTPIAGAPVDSIEPGQIATIRLAQTDVTVDRRDQTGEIGLDLILPTDSARAVYELLLQRGFPHEHVHERVHSTELSAQVRLRPGGWHAFNIARIEAGTPLYYIDFGPDSLPAETGVVENRVSFTKGCYLGQEVVARMHSRGHSKKTLVALLGEAQNLHDRPDAAQSEDPYLAGMAQPISGAQVFPLEGSEPVGVITSSTLSPMNAAAPVCFAAIKQGAATAKARFRIPAEGGEIEMTVMPGLTSLHR